MSETVSEYSDEDRNDFAEVEDDLLTDEEEDANEKEQIPDFLNVG
jgi:hypothetical protein